MNFKQNKIEFEREIKKRGIDYLIHFTPTINLYGMLEHGKIMSRAKLESLGLNEWEDILDYAQLTDEFRMDDKNYINLSISAPNEKLFRKFINKTKDYAQIEWCILKIDSQYIYEIETLFSVTNAASHTAKNIYGISGDFNMFKKLFDETVYIKNQNNHCTISRKLIKPRYTTDEQAEVLVKDKIPFQSVKEICFKSDEKMAEAKAALSFFDTSNFIVDKNIFSPNRNI